MFITIAVILCSLNSPCVLALNVLKTCIACINVWTVTGLWRTRVGLYGRLHNYWVLWALVSVEDLDLRLCAMLRSWGLHLSS
jgi:hypothetical protein